LEAARKSPRKAQQEPLEPFAGLLVRDTGELGEREADPEKSIDIVPLSQLAELLRLITIMHTPGDKEVNKKLHDLISGEHDVEDLYDFSQVSQQENLPPTTPLDPAEDEVLEQTLGKDIIQDPELNEDPPKLLRDLEGRQFLVERIGDLIETGTTFGPARRLRAEAEEYGFTVEEI
jgi:hypothetical protein